MKKDEYEEDVDENLEDYDEKKEKNEFSDLGKQLKTSTEDGQTYEQANNGNFSPDDIEERFESNEPVNGEHDEKEQENFQKYNERTKKEVYLEKIDPIWDINESKKAKRELIDILKETTKTGKIEDKDFSRAVESFDNMMNKYYEGFETLYERTAQSIQRANETVQNHRKSINQMEKELSVATEMINGGLFTKLRNEMKSISSVIDNQAFKKFIKDNNLNLELSDEYKKMHEEIKESKQEDNKKES